MVPKGALFVQDASEDAHGIVFNIQKYSIQDGPGIRTTVFLKGCPMRCAWCANPESQHFDPEIAHRNSLCSKCGRCMGACQEKAISVDARGICIDRKLCTNCGKCIDVCSPQALKMFGEKMSVREVFERIREDAEFYRNSGGGVTVSGGEPLAQPDFVAALFRLCRNNGIETCIETSGCATEEALIEILPYTSLVLFDIKLGDAAAHGRWTMKSNEEILRNLGIAAASGTPLILRVPMIPGINDSDDELKYIAHIALETLKKPARIDLLPYHRFGVGKYQMLDREYQLSELTTPKDMEVQRIKRLFESYGLECEVVA
jgi:pyruvate formate lyase activating enzyme